MASIGGTLDYIKMNMYVHHIQTTQSANMQSILQSFANNISTNTISSSGSVGSNSATGTDRDKTVQTIKNLISIIPGKISDAIDKAYDMLRSAATTKGTKVVTTSDNVCKMSADITFGESSVGEGQSPIYSNVNITVNHTNLKEWKDLQDLMKKL